MPRTAIKFRSDAGVSAVEYALLVVFIAVAIIVVVGILGVDVKDAYASVSF